MLNELLVCKLNREDKAKLLNKLSQIRRKENPQRYRNVEVLKYSTISIPTNTEQGDKKEEYYILLSLTLLNPEDGGTIL